MKKGNLKKKLFIGMVVLIAGIAAFFLFGVSQIHFKHKFVWGPSPETIGYAHLVPREIQTRSNHTYLANQEYETINYSLPTTTGWYIFGIPMTPNTSLEIEVCRFMEFGCERIVVPADLFAQNNNCVERVFKDELYENIYQGCYRVDVTDMKFKKLFYAVHW